MRGKQTRGQKGMNMKLGWPTWIGVVADDLERQRRFYRDTLRLTETEAGPDWVQFDVDGHLFEVIRRSSLPQYETRRYQVGFTVDDIRATRDELIASGLEALTQIEGGDDTDNLWCYFRDPEGNVFEITEWIER
jgi:catechol 2,3-dioxygenase-like lactoylglutathione lyase family enzyme